MARTRPKHNPEARFIGTTRSTTPGAGQACFRHAYTVAATTGQSVRLDYCGEGPVSIIFFDHYDPTTGEELWLNSGNITELVKDINPGPGWSNPQNLTTVGGTLFFTAYDDTNGYQLWKTDGTAAGTVMLTSLPPSVNG